MADTKYCPMCKAEFEGEKCPKCGFKPTEQQVFKCKNCGAVITDPKHGCPDCGIAPDFVKYEEETP